MDSQKLGQGIRILRQNASYTQPMLSQKTGWSVKQISKYERGNVKRINYAFLQDICNVFDVTIDELEDISDVKNP